MKFMSLTKGRAINRNLNYKFLIEEFKCSIFTDVSILPDRKIDLPKKFPFHNFIPLNEALMGHIKYDSYLSHENFLSEFFKDIVVRIFCVGFLKRTFCVIGGILGTRIFPSYVEPYAA